MLLNYCVQEIQTLILKYLWLQMGRHHVDILSNVKLTETFVCVHVCVTNVLPFPC